MLFWILPNNSLEQHQQQPQNCDTICKQLSVYDSDTNIKKIN